MAWLLYILGIMKIKSEIKVFFPKKTNNHAVNIGDRDT